MILNAYAVLDAFVGLLRVWPRPTRDRAGPRGLAAWRRSIQFPEERKKLEDRCYLLFLLGGLLLCLNIVAWPLFYLLLQSYVPQWTGVMCIYGVTQIGKGSMNSSRYLPSLITAVQIFKPILIFLSGVSVCPLSRQSPHAHGTAHGARAAGAAGRGRVGRC